KLRFFTSCDPPRAIVRPRGSRRVTSPRRVPLPPGGYDSFTIPCVPPRRASILNCPHWLIISSAVSRTAHDASDRVHNGRAGHGTIPGQYFSRRLEQIPVSVAADDRRHRPVV